MPRKLEQEVLLEYENRCVWECLTIQLVPCGTIDNMFPSNQMVGGNIIEWIIRRLRDGERAAKTLIVAHWLSLVVCSMVAQMHSVEVNTMTVRGQRSSC